MALANDATAAQANPAGLTRLYVKKPQLSIEGRGWNFFSLTPDRGHAFGRRPASGRMPCSRGPVSQGRCRACRVSRSGAEDTTRSVSLSLSLYARPEHKWVLPATAIS